MISKRKDAVIHSVGEPLAAPAISTRTNTKFDEQTKYHKKLPAILTDNRENFYFNYALFLFVIVLIAKSVATVTTAMMGRTMYHFVTKPAKM